MRFTACETHARVPHAVHCMRNSLTYFRMRFTACENRPVRWVREGQARPSHSEFRMRFTACETHARVPHAVHCMWNSLTYFRMRFTACENRAGPLGEARGQARPPRISFACGLLHAKLEINSFKPACAVANEKCMAVKRKSARSKSEGVARAAAHSEANCRALFGAEQRRAQNSAGGGGWGEGVRPPPPKQSRQIMGRRCFSCAEPRGARAHRAGGAARAYWIKRLLCEPGGARGGGTPPR